MSGQPPSEMAPPRRRDWDALAAVIAALIGLLALTVSGYTAWLQRQQVRAQVWPYLEPGISPSQRQVVLVNKGVGPAAVKSLQVFVDGKPQQDWPHVFDALGLSSMRETPYSTVNGIVISAGERLQQLDLGNAKDFAAFYTRYSQIELRLCYCSALNECWLLDQRDKDRSSRRQPVDECPAGGEDEFIDSKIIEPGDTQPRPQRSAHERQ